jgi:hypothetical protein
MDPTTLGPVKEFAVYTAARLGLFVASYAVVAGVYLLVTGNDSLPVLWPLLLAAVISSVASMTMLRTQRQRFADVVERRARAAADRSATRAAEHPDHPGRPD